mgnify:CR=1
CLKIFGQICQNMEIAVVNYYATSLLNTKYAGSYYLRYP